MVYDGTTNQIRTLAIGSAIDDAPTVAQSGTYGVVTGSNATTTGQALVDVTGMSVALAANHTYEFEAVMSVASSAVTGNKYGVQYSVAGGGVEATIMGNKAIPSAGTWQSERITALNTATTLPYIAAAVDGNINIHGRVTTGANAGNLTIQHLKVTSGTSTVYIGSFLKVKPMS